MKSGAPRWPPSHGGARVQHPDHWFWLGSFPIGKNELDGDPTGGAPMPAPLNGSNVAGAEDIWSHHRRLLRKIQAQKKGAGQRVSRFPTNLLSELQTVSPDGRESKRWQPRDCSDSAKRR